MELEKKNRFSENVSFWAGLGAIATLSCPEVMAPIPIENGIRSHHDNWEVSKKVV